MNVVFTSRQIELLQNVCNEQANASLLEKALAATVSDLEVELLCALISDEMMMNGIEENFEPNAYGIDLEDLLNAVNRKRVSG